MANIQAILYVPSEHSLDKGEVAKVKGKEYFFNYNNFPHGSLDCGRNSIVFDRDLSVEVETRRMTDFENQGRVSRGSNDIKRLIMKVDGEYNQTLTKAGQIFEVKIARANRD